MIGAKNPTAMKNIDAQPAKTPTLLPLNRPQAICLGVR
jgi:hypothetical protein